MRPLLCATLAVCLPLMCTSFGIGGNAGGVSFGATMDLSGNPFFNGDIAKAASGLGSSSAQFSQGASGFTKPQNFQTSYQSSSFSSSSKGNQASQGGFQASFGGSAPAGQGFSSSSKFSGSGYSGAAPSPFTASSGANVNLIQNSQKSSEFDYEQQNQQNIDEAFQETGNVHAHEHSGAGLQQTCAGQGYVCVHKAQCNNGVVNTNGAGILAAKTKKQYCNTKTEICCRIEISTLQGAGGLQGSLGFGSATFSASGSQNSGSQGSGLFASSSQSGASGFGQESASNQGGAALANRGGGNAFGTTGSSVYESSSSSFESSGAANRGSNFGGNNGANGGVNVNGFSAQGSSSFGSNGQAAFGANGAQGFGANGGNRGVTIESSSSSFESSTRGGSFGANAGNAGNGGANFGAAGTYNSNANGFAGNGFTSNSNKFGGFNSNTNGVVKTTNVQRTFTETDSFSAGSDVNGVYRPGAVGLKPGIPYLPPVDNFNSGSSVVSSTAFPTTFATRPPPPPPPPRPVYTTPKPVYTTPKPVYIPPSTTSAPAYLPPQGAQSVQTETRVPRPTYNEGELILDQNRFPNPPRKQVPVLIPSASVAVASVTKYQAGCAAALKCTPIEYCTSDGIISNTTVVLTRDQEIYRVPLTDCKDVETGTLGKCCRDPYYTDPWPVNLIGKWTEGVFGGNDGKYVADSRVSSNNPRPVTARPAVTGSVFLNNYRTPKPTIPSPGPNQVTAGYGTTVSQAAYGQKGQFEVRGEGQAAQGDVGSQYTTGTQNFQQTNFVQTQAQAQGQGQAQAQAVAQGQAHAQAQATKGATYGQRAQTTVVGQGQYAQGERGQFGVGGQGQLEIQEQNFQSQVNQIQGQGIGQAEFQGQGQAQYQGQGQIRAQAEAQSQGQGQIHAHAEATRGQGQIVRQSQGQFITQGSGTGYRQGQGYAVENEYSESIQRVFLQRYNQGGQCGLLNGQKPYGNRNDLEVDFAEIPWQAMVLLQTNKSLLCGGVITRPDVVITTASCVEGLLAKNVLIKGGEWKLGIDDEPLPFQIVQVKHILRHPFYKSGSLHYDAAILVLNENLRLAKNIYPICLPGAQETLDAFYNGAGECVVTGWGKQVLQAHLAGSIMHSLNVSLINPGECQARLSQEYPHLLEQYDQDSCACGQPTNPINNICRVDTGSALACTTGDGHFVLRGVYSWDSGCQPGNQLAAFYKFDLEWYEWAIGLIESARFAQFGGGAQVSQSQNQRFSSQITSGVKDGRIKGGFASNSATSGLATGGLATGGLSGGFNKNQFGQGSQFSQFSSNKFTESSGGGGVSFDASLKPIQNSFSASYSEKKVFQSEPKFVTFTTKPEIFTYTTKPKIVTFTTKPEIITYETSGSVTNPQYVAPGITLNPSFSEVAGAQHTHNAQCKCLEGNK